MKHINRLLKLTIILLVYCSCDSKKLTNIPLISLEDGRPDSLQNGSLVYELNHDEEAKYRLSISGKNIERVAAYVQWNEKKIDGRDTLHTRDLSFNGFKFPLLNKDSIASFVSSKTHEFSVQKFGNTKDVTLIVYARTEVGHETRIRRKISLKSYFIEGLLKLNSLAGINKDSTFVSFDKGNQYYHNYSDTTRVKQSDFGYLYTPSSNYQATLFSPNWDQLNTILGDDVKWEEGNTTFFAQVDDKKTKFDEIHTLKDLFKVYPKTDVVKAMFLNGLQLGESDVIAVLLKGGRRGFLKLKITGQKDGYAVIEYKIETFR